MADIVPGVPWRWVASPNHGGTRPETRLIIVHTSRSGSSTNTVEQEYQGTVNFCARANPASVGPHFVIGEHEVTRMIHDVNECWCTGNRAVPAYDLNQESLAYEMAQATRSTPIPDGIYVNAADVTARWCIAYNIPPVHLPAYSDATGRGILGHDETRDGRYDGKTDPGPMWDWVKFIGLVVAKIKDLTVPPATDTLLAYVAAHPELGTVFSRGDAGFEILGAVKGADRRVSLVARRTYTKEIGALTFEKVAP